MGAFEPLVAVQKAVESNPVAADAEVGEEEEEQKEEEEEEQKEEQKEEEEQK